MVSLGVQMSCTRREFLSLVSASAASVGLAACSTSTSRSTSSSDDGQSSQQTTDSSLDLTKYEKLAIDMSAWKYDEDNNVYYQLGLTYCLDPATTAYESLAIFVPGDFFTGEQNGDTYKCTINSKGVVGNFTPSTAPILMPINTGTLSPQASPTKYGYDGLSPYLDAGCIYVYAGFRGRSAGYDSSSGQDELYPGGSPWPLVDLKAAVRYLRYNAESLPCDSSRIFVFGFSAGGGLSALLGSTGNAEAYKSYLDSIGAAEYTAKGVTISDAIYGSASWCPTTSFDTSNESYEWMMGQFATTGDRADGTLGQALSQGLAGDYATYINSTDLRDDDDSQLTLDETEGSVYSLGSYTNKLVSLLNEAATNFVADTAFPYTYTPQRVDDPTFPGDPNLATTRATESAVAAQTTVDATTTSTDGSTTDATTTDSTTETTTSALPTGTTQVQSTIFDTVQNYFSALNYEHWWINYNVSRQTVSISSLRDFVTYMRPAGSEVPVFDALDRSTTVNQLFGVGDESTLHFDKTLGDRIESNQETYATLTGWDDSYATAWSDDLAKTDSLDNDIATRVNLFNPLYFLSGTYSGYGTGSVAPYWRINEGAFNSDTSLCDSANLALALKHYSGVSEVIYQPIWGLGHVLAERSGTPTDNLIAWVVNCCQSS